MTPRVPTLVCVVLLAAACSGAATGVGDGSGPSVDATRTTAQDAPSIPPGRLQPSEGFAVTEIVFTDGGRRVPLSAFVADDPALRATGLMGRTELPDDAGMLFVFDAATTGAFWMKDTLLPLSIAFVGEDGTVQQILDMDPCTAEPCPRYAPDDAYVYAVEANQGYFTQRGIEAGWSAEIDHGGGGR